MLGGSIDVRSELGKGTEVRVILPMIRSNSAETPVSTPNSSSTLDRQQDDSIAMLRERAKDMTVTLYGFSTNPPKSNRNSSMSVDFQVEKSLSTYITDWYGIAVTASPYVPSSADIIIVDEGHLDAFRAAYSTALGKPAGPAIVCLCFNTTRHRQSSSFEGGNGIIEFVSKPFGPYKLARALRSCLDKPNNPLQETVISQVGVEHTEQASESRIGDILPEFEKVTIETEDNEPAINILDNGKVQANGESTNAHLAIGMDSTDGKEPPDSRTDYPFPHVDGPLPRDDRVTTPPAEGSLPRRKTVPLIPHTDANHISAVSRRGKTASTSEPSKETHPSETESRQEKPPPRILLVDDNKINLRLLQTYMRKRHYSFVDSADDGGEAVRAFGQSDGYDIIFMGTFPPTTTFFCGSSLTILRYLHARPQRLRSHARHSPHRG